LPLLNLHEYETAARDLLPPMVFDFVAGGSGDEVTVRANRAAFERWRLLPRVLCGLREVSTATSVLGQQVTLPVLIAPSSLHRLCHEEGEGATARAAKAAGTIYTMSTVSTLTIEEVAPEAGPWWFQLYVFADRSLSRDLVARAVAAGASALVVTVDTPLLGRREGDTRNRFALPPGVTMANMAAPAPRLPGEADAGSGWFAAAPMVEPALSWDDLDWLASLSPLPILLKGILHPADAERAIEYGTRAILVSNHGGRQLDTVLSGADALPPIVEAVDSRVDVLVDGGIRRGWDVAKALALGADAVLVGRPLLWGLAREGRPGVEAVLRQLLAEFDGSLALLGCPRARDLDTSYVTRAPW
jgi:4-hydroxymandelate oxidase